MLLKYIKGISVFISLLEVGALLPDNYASCSSWIDVTPIDLNSRHPAIKQQDFLKMDVLEHASKWDLISLSLVLNFVPDAHDRGQYALISQMV
jgi:25S rRNA (adenine2142-N1)-methyltransferase